MAERLEVTKSWLSRYLDLARLPPEVIAAFGSPHVIGISHGAVLAPVLRNPVHGEKLVDEARRLAGEQADLRSRSEPAIPPAAVVQRLLGTTRTTGRGRGNAQGSAHVVRASDGGIIAKAQKPGRGGGITISLPSFAKHDRSALVAAVEEILDQLGTARRAIRPGDR